VRSYRPAASALQQTEAIIGLDSFSLLNRVRNTCFCTTDAAEKGATAQMVPTYSLAEL
jgi:hypothetical protein